MKKTKQFYVILYKALLLIILTCCSCTQEPGTSNNDQTDEIASVADVVFNGVTTGDNAGFSVATAGDVNFDGLDDMLIGAPGCDNGALTDVGKTYLIYGKVGGWSSPIDFANADVTLVGRFESSLSGASVSSAGDFNNDGFDDILIGAPGFNPSLADNTGAAYLVYGNNALSPTINLVMTGVSFRGKDAYDNSGHSVALAGDVNGDGYDDILVGAFGYDDGSNTDAGKVYLIFGTSDVLPGQSSLEAMCDASFIGESSYELAGYCVSSAGDVNSDGYDDILIGAYGNSDLATSAGKTYLILGKATGWAVDTPLSTADASFRGESENNQSGFSVAGAGDLNGDNFDDIIISAPGYSYINTETPKGANESDTEIINAGKIYIIFGKSGGWAPNEGLGLADATFIGEFDDQFAGTFIAPVGNMDGDQYDDFSVCTEPVQGPVKNINSYSASSYIISGRETALWNTDVSLFTADAALRTPTDGNGKVSSVMAGDVNGDGYSDILTGVLRSISDPGQAFLYISDNAIYVDISATGGNNGTSWDDAFTSLDDALAAAVSGESIYIAEGDYVPQIETTPGDPRSCAFTLKDGVSIYGGFPEGGSGMHLRNPAFHETLFTGDKGIFDNRTDNCYHVIKAENIGADTIINGLTINRGTADGVDTENQKGGGIYLVNSSLYIMDCFIAENHANQQGAGIFNNNSSPKIIDCWFSGNYIFDSDGKGAGLANTNSSSPYIYNCLFSGNDSAYSGGAIYNTQSEAAIFDCNFVGNTAQYGGAIHSYSSSDPNIVNCNFNSNQADEKGGGIYCDVSSMEVINCVFTGNQARDGGGLNANDSSTQVINSTFYANDADEYGGGLSAFCDAATTLTIANSIFWGNNSQNGNVEESQVWIDDLGGMYSVAYCCVQDDPSDPTIPFDGSLNNNIDTNPWFVDPNGSDSIPGTFDDDLHLQSSSPCIDNGNNADLPDKIKTDFDGNDRIEDGDGNWVEDIDMGAFERQVDSIIYVKHDATGNADGSSWQDAYNYLADAITDAQTTPRDIWVAADTYYPDQNSLDTTGSDNPNATFTLIGQVGIYGGLAGTEHPATFNLDDRNFTANETILSGDIGLPGDPTDNCFHVVSAVDGTTTSAKLDGFTITDGNASGNFLEPNSVGGGIYMFHGSATVANCYITTNTAMEGAGMYCGYAIPIVKNCIFTGNNATDSGGAVHNESSNPQFISCTFDNNTSDDTGGGAANSHSNPEFTACIFTNNTAQTGGGVYSRLFCYPVVRNSLYVNNIASISGGAVFNEYCNFTMTNCTVVANKAQTGGGLVNSTEGVSTITNCIFDQNCSDYTGSSGGPFYDEYAQILNGDPNTISYCYIQNVGDYFTGGNYLFPDDPLFVNAAGDDGQFGTIDDDLRLQFISPYINAGDPVGDYTGQTDLDGQQRVRYGQVDLGAYEVFPIAGDLEPDEDVDLVDFSYFASEWLGICDDANMWCNEKDIDRSGDVDITDLNLMANHWLYGID